MLLHKEFVFCVVAVVNFILTVRVKNRTVKFFDCPLRFESSLPLFTVLTQDFLPVWSTPRRLRFGSAD